MVTFALVSVLEDDCFFVVAKQGIINRLFDIVFASLGLVILSPLLLIVAAAIKLQDGGRALYHSVRVGRGGQLFRLLKFRTMHPDSEKLGSGITISGDDRVTPFGRILRKTKLDELPQFWNVLAGEMSFVGPRPEDPRYVKLYSQEQRKLLALRPGITSPASIVFRNEEELLKDIDSEKQYVNQILPAKLAIELEYFSKQTLLDDIGLIFKTLVALFRYGQKD